MSGYIGNIPTPQATQTRDTFTATSGQTSFATSGYTPSFLDVFLNGVHLVNGTDYTATNGSDVVLTSGAAAGDVLEVVAYSTFEPADVTASSGFTVTGNLSVDGGTIKLDGNYPVGTGNVALGDTALDSNVSGTRNTALGSNSLTANTASDNTAVGYQALYDNTTGARLTAVGESSLGNNTTGNNNVAVGEIALSTNTTGSDNVAIGREAGFSNSTGNTNTYVGGIAGYYTTTSGNTCIGYGAGWEITTGSKNTILGRYDGNQGGLDIRTSSNNIVLSDGDGNPELFWNTTAWNFTGPSGAGAITTDGTQFIPGNDKVEYRWYCGTTVSRTAISFRNPNGQVGYISVSGTSTNYNTSSDYRLKENVVELTGATDRLKQLNPSRFNFINTPEATVDGFLAHEVQTIVPEAVTGTKDEVDADGNPVYQGIDQSKLVPLLVATIKELEARIAALEAN